MINILKEKRKTIFTGNKIYKLCKNSNEFSKLSLIHGQNNENKEHHECMKSVH